MPFVYHGGVRELLRLARAANPTLPADLSESNCYFPKLSAVAEEAEVVLAGKYGKGVSGYRTLSYQRLSLAKLFKGGTVRVGVVELKPLHELLGDIYESTGFAFDVTDLVPVTFDQEQTLPCKVLLKAAVTSFIYFDEVEIELVARLPRLKEVVLQRDVTVETAGVVTSETRERAEFLTFGIDYTSKRNELSAITPGSMLWSDPGSEEALRCNALYDALNAIDHLPWRTTAENVAWTLNGARVVYNERVGYYDPTWWDVDDIRRPNPRYDRVLVVVFEQDTTGPSGFYGSAMFIHYNSQLDNEVTNGNS